MNSIQKFCNNKSIAIVGNSESLLNNTLGNKIDEHDIVVRINHAPKYISKFPKNVGTKTTIMSYGISKLQFPQQISKICNPEYNLFLIRCNGQITNYNQYSCFKNPVHGTIEEYSKLSSQFGKFKPSTGACTINYFVNNINFSKLSLFGFDFFNSASKFKKNAFGSYYYKDHNDTFEKQFINNTLNDKIVIFY